MIRKITLLFVACIAWLLPAQAQKLCGFDAIHQNLMAQDPAYNQMIQQNTYKWIQHQQAASNGLVQTTPNGTVYEIPVVIHVMYTGSSTPATPTSGNYNPTNAALTGMIDYLNKAYAATWAGYPDTSNGGAFIPIRFKLAQRDSACNSTTGILRYNMNSNATYVANGVNSSNTNGISDLALKNTERWNPSDYYNIWIVNKIDGQDGITGSGSFIAGYAYFAGSPANVDGTIMLASQAVAGEITLPHEIGHAMGLYHVFQVSPTNGGGVGICPPNTNCNSDGDQVCDTEPMGQSPFNCPSGTNPCTGLAWQNTQHNFMDYSNCQDRFTAGQRTKMLFNLLLYRASLLSSLGAQPLGTATLAANCTPASSNPSNTFNYGPRSVSLNDMTETSDGYNGDGNLVYVNKACVQRANLTIGGSYTLSVNTGSNPENVAVYIDYNNDGTFASTERIWQDLGTTGNSHSTIYNVPTSGITTCTPLRMRVISDASSNTTLAACGPLTYGQAEDYTVYFKPAGSTANVTIAANPTGVTCPGSAITFTATPGSNATGITYKWYVNGTLTSTTNPFVSSTVTNGSTVKVEMFYTSTTGCTADSAFSNTITVQRSTPVTPSVSVTATGNPACAGQLITFTATPVNGGTPGYQWYVNGTAVPGATNATYSSSSFTNGNTVYVVMTPAGVCVSPATATSNTITVVISGNLVPSVSITAAGNPGCSGQPISFTATPTNGGTAPAYQWYVNGTQVTGATNSTYNSTTLNSGDLVTVTMVSNSPCATTTNPVTSNTITISFTTLTAAVSIAQTGGTNPICAGKPATFTATPINPGTSPVYGWFINGTQVAGATSSTFTSTTLNNGDIVTSTLTSNNPCVTNPTVTSNSIAMAVNPIDTPTITVTITKGSNPGCQDSIIEFTATSALTGVNPGYAFFVNGTQVSSTATFSSVTLATGDVVTARVVIYTPGCRTSDTVYSAPITITRNPSPATPVISLIGNMLVANATSVQWYGPGGIISGATSQNYHPTQAGSYYCVGVNGGCMSGPSNVLLISMLTVNSYNLNNVQIYPNPTTGMLNLDWGTKNVNVSVDVYSSLGQGLLHDEVRNASNKVMNLNTLANGVYFVVIRDEDGKTGTVRVTLNR
ncbi:M43 family zinc metalloprotease [Chitinophagaceae bacterium MMS25-I14]